jgi:hypothetical protein
MRRMRPWPTLRQSLLLQARLPLPTLRADRRCRINNSPRGILYLWLSPRWWHMSLAAERAYPETSSLPVQANQLRLECIRMHSPLG